MTLLDIFKFVFKEPGTNLILIFKVSFANVGQFIALTRDAKQEPEGTVNLLPLCIYTYESTKQICKSLI